MCPRCHRPIAVWPVGWLWSRDLFVQLPWNAVKDFKVTPQSNPKAMLRFEREADRPLVCQVTLTDDERCGLDEESARQRTRVTLEEARRPPPKSEACPCVRRTLSCSCIAPLVYLKRFLTPRADPSRRGATWSSSAEVRAVFGTSPCAPPSRRHARPFTLLRPYLSSLASRLSLASSLL